MNELQERIFTMFKWFHKFCVENDIAYYAIGGTALGAIRHQGFIPWDDDIDVGLPRKDYDKLISLMEGKKFGNYVLEQPLQKKDFVYQYCKLYDTSTTLIENTRYKTKRGVFIDVFPLDGIGNTYEESLKNFSVINRKNNLIMTKVCALSGHRKLYKNLAIVLLRWFPFLNWRKMIKTLDDKCRAKDFYQFEYVGNLFGNWHEKEIMQRAWFGTPTIYRFESMEIFGPENYDKYLSALYGNYMELPPKEKQKTHHDYLYLDIDKSY